jgi:glycosyltransferase involved in cell wall biosynthesis
MHRPDILGRTHPVPEQIARAVKTLTLISSGLERPDHEQLKRLEADDKFPRVSLYWRELNTTLLDEHSLADAPPLRRSLYRRLPVFAGQALEAYRTRRNYDAVVSWAESLGLLFALRLKASRTHYPHVALFSWISKPKKARILRFVHEYIDRIILWSTVQRDFAINTLGIPDSRIVLTRWHVDQKFWRPMPEDGNMVCSVGSEMRDYPTLIAALGGSDIPCHIAAGTLRALDTPWMKAVDQRDTLPGNITIGKKSPLELRQLYARSRFVVIPILPTDTDNGVTCILEGMAMGKAVICSRVHGQRDVIEEGVNGLYVPPQDPRALREAVEYLWTNPDVAERMGRAGRALVERHHTLDQFVHLVRSTVEEVLDHRGSHKSPLKPTSE